MKGRKYRIKRDMLTIKSNGCFIDEVCVQLMNDLNLIVNEDNCFMLTDEEAKERTENVGEWKWIDLPEGDCASLAEAINLRDELMLKVQQLAGINIKPL